MEAFQIDIIRRMPPWKKMAMVADLNQTVRMLALSGLRQRNPDASEEQLKRMLADLMLGDELASKVYGERKDSS